jgi:prepilin-type N-terminal cleavage/methylation domain-containing protein
MRMFIPVFPPPHVALELIWDGIFLSNIMGSNMGKKQRKIAGFTLMELLVVVVIMGIIAAFASPSYTRAIQRARAKDAINNLTAIHAAQLIYRSLNGSFIACADVAAINGINGANSLNVIPNGSAYSCPGAPVTCRADSANFNVVADLTAAISPGTNPVCNPIVAGSCP